MPIVSVIMSTYNTAEEYLKQSIQSILDQSYSDFEFIIIDDCSIGNDASVIDEFSDKRIKLIKNETNRGLAYSLNCGIAAASGKYIVRMDSDDIASPDRLKLQIGYMETHPDVDIMGARAFCFGGRSGPAIMDFGTDEYIKADLFFTDLILHPTVVMRADSLKRYGLRYNDKLRRAQDYDLWVRAAEVCKFYIMPDVVLKYRCHDQQATAIARDKQLAVCRMVYDYYFRKLNIEYNDNNIMLHRALNGTSDEIIKATDVYRWVKKLRKANNEVKIFDKNIFDELLGSKLIYSVFKLKRKISFSAADIFRIFTLRNVIMVIKHRNRNNDFIKTFYKNIANSNWFQEE